MFCFGPNYQAPRSTAEHDHKLEETKDKFLMRDLVQKAALIRWVTNHIVEQG